MRVFIDQVLLLGLLRSLNGVPAAQSTTPDPKWEETIKTLSESSQVQSFLEHHSKMRGKTGVCRYFFVVYQQFMYIGLLCSMFCLVILDSLQKTWK